MDTNELINFNELKKSLGIEKKDLFLIYLKEVYKDLADRNEIDHKKGITKIIFYDYLKLPMYLSEKLFTIFDTDKDEFLKSKEFIIGMYKLYNGDFEESIKLVFDILDFDNDNYIEKDDIKIILSLLPLKTDNSKIEYKYQMDSLEEINNIINITFGESDKLNLEEFKTKIEKEKSDIFLQILCFLYLKKPFTSANINVLETSTKKVPNISIPEDDNKDTNDNILLPPPSKDTSLSPVSCFFKSNKIKHPFISGENLETGEGPESATDGQNKIEENNQNDNNKSENTKDNDNKFRDIYNNISYENYIFKYKKNGKLLKFYVVLINKDVFYYKSKDKEKVLGMHNLSGCFLKENGKRIIKNKSYLRFTIIYPTKEKNYYCLSREVYDNFVEALNESFGNLNFYNYYEMLNDLGEGIFGSVKLCKDKKTNKKFSVKIIKKEKAKDSNDMESVRSEIDIMKLCHHPNVVHLIDHFENGENIFIVMEYIQGGNLSEYLRHKKFNITEKRAAELIYQICLGIEYLHKYGIMHRDLKPDNIMLTEDSDNGKIKIMDFGLSKILGSKESASEGFGTLIYVSPEVLIRKPYNKEVDIWSIGIILYYILSGDLPYFDKKDNQEKIAKTIVFKDVKFPKKKFGNRSEEAIDLIKKCLTKEPKDRIKVEGILQSEWIKKNIDIKE